MAEEIKRNEQLTLDDTVKSDRHGNPILGVLEGPCADVINPTRNDRQYDEELWERVFNDDLINEFFESGGILGELDHPADRTETDTSKVAICMPEKPKKGKDGKLYAKFDILDTPNGRIAYTLAKYGYKLGVSSRGDGDVYEAFDGKEHVDPKTYTLKAFDLVLLPAVKAARLKLKESVGNKTLKQAIRESLEKSSVDDRRIMCETLDNLNIDYKPKKRIVKKAVSCTEQIQDTSRAAIDSGASEIVEELKMQIRNNKELTEKLQSVQEKLSVCYAKEAKYQERISELSNLRTNDNKVKDLESKIAELQEQLNIKDKTIKSQKARLVQLFESRKSRNQEGIKSLNESIENSKLELQKKDREIRGLKENLVAVQSKSNKADAEINRLTESISDYQTKLSIKSKEYSEKINKANKIVEHYKAVADNVFNKYIEDKAEMYGIDADQIRTQLKEGFTFKDIDTICENLQKYKISFDRLPVNLQNGKVKTKITEAVEPILPRTNVDDEVDDSLLRLAGLNEI